MSDTPYLVRRARYLLSMTQRQFAELFDVDEGTVSRWERGKLHPSPDVISRINDIDREGSILGIDVLRASPIWKYASPVDDLRHPIDISKGLRSALKKAGRSEEYIESYAKEIPESTPQEHSTVHALNLIQRHPLWINRRALYAEALAVSDALGWIDFLAAPFPHGPLALVVFAPVSAEEGGFWVRVVGPEAFHPPK
jgi:transcriptional regulator with XRE-family HTH domain